MEFAELPSREAVLTPEKEIKFFGDEDIELIYNEAKAFRNHSNFYPKYWASQAVILLMYTGMRVGEALGLTWEDVNFEKCQITLTTQLLLLKIVLKMQQLKILRLILHRKPKLETE